MRGPKTRTRVSSSAGWPSNEGVRECFAGFVTSETHFFKPKLTGQGLRLGLLGFVELVIVLNYCSVVPAAHT